MRARITQPMYASWQLTFRKTEARDIPSLLRVRGLTRQNAVSQAQLREWGITPESIAEGFASLEFYGRVCEADGAVVGFCTGNLNTGEVIVLAVLPEFEGKKIGLTLLNGVVEELSARKLKSIWLACSSDPQSRSHGFYRANGWAPNGEVLGNGDEILVCTDLHGRMDLMANSKMATTPEPPYFAVIFTSTRSDGDQGYAAMAEDMVALASRQPGFLGVDSVRGSDGLGITVSYWSSEEAIQHWKKNGEHQVARKTGRETWYEDFFVRIAKVERAYGKQPSR